MSLKDSTDLIERKESFSGGASVTNFMTQWNLPAPETGTTGDEKFLEFSDFYIFVNFLF